MSFNNSFASVKMENYFFFVIKYDTFSLFFTFLFFVELSGNHSFIWFQIRVKTRLFQQNFLSFFCNIKQHHSLFIIKILQQKTNIWMYVFFTWSNPFFFFEKKILNKHLTHSSICRLSKKIIKAHIYEKTKKYIAFKKFISWMW